MFIRHGRSGLVQRKHAVPINHPLLRRNNKNIMRCDSKGHYSIHAIAKNRSHCSTKMSCITRLNLVNIRQTNTRRNKIDLSRTIFSSTIK